MVIEEFYGEVAQLESEPEVNKVGEISEGIPFNIPEKWSWIRLGELVNYGSSKQMLADSNIWATTVK